MEEQKEQQKIYGFLQMFVYFFVYWIYQLISTYQREYSGLFRCRLNGWVIRCFSEMYFIRSFLPYY